MVITGTHSRGTEECQLSEPMTTLGFSSPFVPSFTLLDTGFVPPFDCASVVTVLDSLGVELVAAGLAVKIAINN